MNERGQIYASMLWLINMWNYEVKCGKITATTLECTSAGGLTSDYYL